MVLVAVDNPFLSKAAQTGDSVYLEEHGHDTQATKYYVLLCIVKSKSPKDYLYISFVEGLHRHAAILLCLTCSCFDLQNNTL